MFKLGQQVFRMRALGTGLRRYGIEEASFEQLQRLTYEQLVIIVYHRWHYYPTMQKKQKFYPPRFVATLILALALD
jgi:hypothetical protein